MKYTISQISEIIQGDIISQLSEDISILHVVYDTRKISYSASSIFVALRGQSNDGHHYISDAISKGIKAIIVEKNYTPAPSDNVHIIKVDDCLTALQKLAAYHRQKFNYPVIGITGSNGKTTVKEWLYQSLLQRLRVIQSPQSYNSQLGVALSVLMMEEEHELAIIEAGISRTKEMANLHNVIKPTIGIFTNIGDAHSGGFESIEMKIQEKMKLFSDAELLIYNRDNKLINQEAVALNIPQLLTWGMHQDSIIHILESKQENQDTHLNINYKNQNYRINLSFTQNDLIENCMSVISYLIYSGWDNNSIQSAISQFKSLNNRLELREGKNNCLLINDSYSLDIASLRLALEYQNQHALGKEKMLIISDFMDQGQGQEIWNQLKTLIQEKNIKHLIGIGFSQEAKGAFSIDNMVYYDSSEQCLLHHPFQSLSDICILIKGARHHQLEKIYEQLSSQVHETILETDYNAIAHNLKIFKSIVPKETMMMAVLKAEAYGSGSVPMAHFLSDKGIDYLGVALIDEAVKIRQSGITTPILVFNVQEKNLELLWHYNLEPEIYSFRLLELIIEQSRKENKALGIHIKLDTGMHRLGFENHDMAQLVATLDDTTDIKVLSVFTHLSASEAKTHDSFTRQQILKFDILYKLISEKLKYKPIRHILNTGGIMRHSASAYEMVRLGIGLYGIDTTDNPNYTLQKAHALSTKILQIKKLNKGETTGYSRSGVAAQDMTIAIIGLGYADGLMRCAGNGNISVTINGHKCPTIANICMDVTIIDISAHNLIREGDKVVIFDSQNPVENLAESCNTISYEILTRISPRVKRTYIYN